MEHENVRRLVLRLFNERRVCKLVEAQVQEWELIVALSERNRLRFNGFLGGEVRNRVVATASNRNSNELRELVRHHLRAFAEKKKSGWVRFVGHWNVTGELLEDLAIKYWTSHVSHLNKFCTMSSKA